MIHTTVKFLYQNIQIKYAKLFILWFPGLQLYGVALRDTIHFDHVTSHFLLCPLLYGVALSDSVHYLRKKKIGVGGWVEKKMVQIRIINADPPRP